MHNRSIVPYRNIANVGFVRVKDAYENKPIARGSGSYLTPFCKGGRSVEFDVSAGVKMSFLIELLVD